MAPPGLATAEATSHKAEPAHFPAPKPHPASAIADVPNTLSSAGNMAMQHAAAGALQGSTTSATSTPIFQSQPNAKPFLSWSGTAGVVIPPYSFRQPTVRFDIDPLYYAKTEKGCTSCHPTVQRPVGGPPPVQRSLVTFDNIRAWTDAHIWSLLGQHLGRDRIFSLLQRGFLGFWVEEYADQSIAIVDSAVTDDMQGHTFEGSPSARQRFADYLRVNREDIISIVYDQAKDWLANETLAALQSRQVPVGSELVLDSPSTVIQIEDHPEYGTMGLGRHNAFATVGFEWGYKTVKSIHTESYLYYELNLYRGIYFSLDQSAFFRTDPLIGSVAMQVYESTKAWSMLMTCVGNFFKGIATAIASIGEMVIDAGAKVVDMISLYIAVETKAKFGKEIPYTCLSSTCRKYEKCAADPNAHGCKADLLVESLKEAAALALPVIPLGQQAVQCATGDCEACGQVAVIFLPAHEVMKAVHEGASKRGAGVAKKGSEPAAADVAVKTKLEPAAKPYPKGKITDPLVKRAVDASAQRLHISAETAEHEIVELAEEASDPANVHEPSDGTYDAEIRLPDGVTYKRNRGTTFWDRCWNPCERGASVGPEVEAETDAALQGKTGKGKPGPRQGPISTVESRILAMAGGKRVYVGSYIKVEVEGAAAAEGLGIEKWYERGGEKTSALPPVKPYGPARSYQPSAGVMVQPGPESRVVEVMTWNTSEPAKDLNVSHSERQFTEWYESQMKENKHWTDRVKKITIVIFGLDICPNCGHDLARLKALVQESNPNAEVTFIRGDSGAQIKDVSKK